jgi:hypothetical protein
MVLNSWSNWNLESWFLQKQQNQRIRRKTLKARQRTNNSTHIWHLVWELNPGGHSSERHEWEDSSERHALSLLCNPCFLCAKCNNQIWQENSLKSYKQSAIYSKTIWKGYSTTYSVARWKFRESWIFFYDFLYTFPRWCQSHLIKL